jgi:hypothetical protein
MVTIQNLLICVFTNMFVCLDVYRNPPNKRVFGPYYAPERPLGSLKGAQRPPSHHDVLHNVSGSMLMDALENVPNDQLHFYTGKSIIFRFPRNFVSIVLITNNNNNKEI